MILTLVDGGLRSGYPCHWVAERCDISVEDEPSHKLLNHHMHDLGPK